MRLHAWPITHDNISREKRGREREGYRDRERERERERNRKREQKKKREQSEQGEKNYSLSSFKTVHSGNSE